MAISKAKKETLVADLTALLADAKLTAYARYQGLTVADLQDLRRAAREAGVKIKVVKNRLVRVAMNEIAVYKDIYESPYGDTYRYHFPAVLRSRIRDRNTLCIEKVADFDAHGPVQVYIHAMYSTLNTGELTGLSEGTPLALSCTPELSLLNSSHACVIGPDWVWLYLGLPHTIGQVREDMEIVLGGFPADAACGEFPIMGIDNQRHHDNGGVHYASLRGGRISIPYATRNSGYSSADNPFVYLFLVREPAAQEQEGSESQTI